MRSVSTNVAPRFFSERRIKRRILLICLAYFLLFFVIIGRTVELHIADNTKLTKLAQNQYQKRVTLAPKRGNIYDSHGEELSLDVKVDSLYANPRAVSDPSSLARELAPLLGMDSEKIETSLSKDKKFVWIKRQLRTEESAKVQALHNEALGLVKEFRRYYPNKKLAATILGAVGLDSVALGGLELYYDEYLKSEGQPMVVDQDARGQSYSPGAVERENPNNIVLTLDKTIQFITEKELSSAVGGTQSKSGIAVVMNTRTGEILAMASAPDFDPNQYSSFDLSQWRNRAVTDSFEPGSIFKAITAAAALESGRVSLDQKFNCEGGALKVGKFTINDHGHYGAMALPDIIRVSSNIGSFKVAQYLGRETFSDMVVNFGFGKKTGIDLPGEASGIMANPDTWASLQTGTIAFGQGISVTPIQIVTAYSAIANGGYLMKPYVVKQVHDSKGNILRENKPQIVRQVMGERNARKLVELLKAVVGPGGTGTAAQVEEYGVAGKTGTAQKVIEGHSGYAEGKFIASFVGVAPADDPRIAVLVSLNEPRGNHFGGVVAAPVFREIVRQVLPYMGVAPMGNKGPVIIAKAEAKGAESQPKAKGVSESKNKALSKSNLKKKEKEADPAHDVPTDLTELEPGTFRIPDYKGKALREILKNWKDSDLKLSVDGSGLRRTGSGPRQGGQERRGGEIII
jgi:cell division protein FtsI (penicillin-binding protein 3)